VLWLFFLGSQQSECETTPIFSPSSPLPESKYSQRTTWSRAGTLAAPQCRSWHAMEGLTVARLLEHEETGSPPQMYHYMVHRPRSPLNRAVGDLRYAFRLFNSTKNGGDLCPSATTVDVDHA